jgi:hypothetical protein
MKLLSLITGKGNVYLAHGFGQGSTAHPWQEVRAFRIEGGQNGFVDQGTDA